MLGKVLITLLVIFVAVIVLRRQRSRQRMSGQSSRLANPSRQENQGPDRWQGNNRQSSTAPDTQQPMATTMKTVLWFILAGIVVAGSAVTYFQWQDQQRLVTVLLYRNADQTPVIYRVSKQNLGDSSFITEDGIQVTVSANERMEIIGL